MSLVPSLLQAIVGVDGEALVMHAGDRPYVVAPSGQIELASRGLTLEAVNGIVAQLLSPEAAGALDEFGAIQHELPHRPEFPGESFTIVAARGGDDVWVEIRRRRIADDDSVPEEFFATPTGDDASAPAARAAQPPAQPVAAESSSTVRPPLAEERRAAAGISQAPPQPAPAWQSQSRATSQAPPTSPSQSLPQSSTQAQSNSPSQLQAEPHPQSQRPPTPAGHENASHFGDEDLALPDAEELWRETPAVASPPPSALPVAPKATAPTPEPPSIAGAPASSPAAAAPPASSSEAAPTPPSVAAPPATLPDVVPPPSIVPAAVASAERASQPVEPITASIEPTPTPTPTREVGPPSGPSAQGAAKHAEGSWPRAAAPPPPASVVVPMSRSPIRTDVPASPATSAVTGLDRLLRLAAVRGASTLYLSSGARPSVRVDGEIQLLEGEPSLGPNDVESLILTLMPERNYEALRSGLATEWISDLEDVGRVRCMSFRDHRGPGGVFRMMPVRAVTTDQLGLPRGVQMLAAEPEGLILVAGPRLSGKRTLISAFVDLVNRTRRDHVITIESEINAVHERGTAFISQREVRGNYEDVLDAARGALREDPDVLVVESLRTAPLISLGLDAAASGQLVVGGFPAHSATAVVDRIINLYPAEQRKQIQLALAENVRGIVSQVLLRKIGGGRVPAREVLLTTPAVASVIAEGRTSQLPMVIEGGRRQGMVPLNDMLVGLVQSGTVAMTEAYRCAADRPGFLALLKRVGVDTAELERFA